MPLLEEWWKRLAAHLNPFLLRSLESRDKRKHAIGMYTCETLFANGLNISFHPTDAMRTMIGQKQFEHVRGKAGREPMMLLHLDEARPVLNILVCV